MIDISWETHRKYTMCTMHRGLWYADSDFGFNGKPIFGAIPVPGKAWRISRTYSAFTRRREGTCLI